MPRSISASTISGVTSRRRSISSPAAASIGRNSRARSRYSCRNVSAPRVSSVSISISSTPGDGPALCLFWRDRGDLKTTERAWRAGAQAGFGRRGARPPGTADRTAMFAEIVAAFHGGNTTMQRKIILAGAMLAGFVLPALAQTSYYIVQDTSTKKCRIVDQKPVSREVTVVGGDG